MKLCSTWSIGGLLGAELRQDADLQRTPPPKAIGLSLQGFLPTCDLYRAREVVNFGWDSLHFNQPHARPIDPISQKVLENNTSRIPRVRPQED